MRIVVVIITKALDIIGRVRVFKIKCTLLKVISNDGYISFGSINEHLKGKNRKLDSNRLRNEKSRRTKYSHSEGPCGLWHLAELNLCRALAQVL